MLLNHFRYATLMLFILIASLLLSFHNSAFEVGDSLNLLDILTVSVSAESFDSLCLF